MRAAARQQVLASLTVAENLGFWARVWGSGRDGVEDALMAADSAVSEVGALDLGALDSALEKLAGVLAHEIAHQWWAHQIIGAEMQGGTMLSETLAHLALIQRHAGLAIDF